jgi:hypothetical protein
MLETGIRGEVISAEAAEAIQNAGINVVDIKFGDKKLRIIGNGIVNIHSVLPNVDLSSLHIKEYVNYEVLKNIMENTFQKNIVLFYLKLIHIFCFLLINSNKIYLNNLNF